VRRRSFLAGLGLVTAGGVVGAGAGFSAEPALASESPTARTARPGGQSVAFTSTVTFRTAPSAKLMALTIDDGPTALWTPKMLAVLAKHDVVATFFLVGKRLAAEPDPTRTAAAAGHELGNHTWEHADLTRHDAGFVTESLHRNHDLIAAVPPALRADRFRRSGCVRCPRVRRCAVVRPHHREQPGRRRDDHAAASIGR
jgi:peptidoglycan/xylan/chitin deacetylase (PgdA/CDA1 family)